MQESRNAYGTELFSIILRFRANQELLQIVRKSSGVLQLLCQTTNLSDFVSIDK